MNFAPPEAVRCEQIRRTVRIRGPQRRRCRMNPTVADGVAYRGLAVRLALACLLTLIEPAWSASLSAPEWGEPNCAQWLQRQDARTRDWLLGFLSGLGLAWAAEGRTPPRPLNALSSVDEPFVWMNDFCRDHPREAIGRGAIVLFFELARRQEAR